MPTVEERLAAMGLTVHEVVPPVAAYVPAVVTGRHVYTSGQLPFVDGVLPDTGKVGAEVTPERAAELAAICALNAIAAVKSVSLLEEVVRVVKVTVFVASAPGFTGQPAVANGPSPGSSPFGIRVRTSCSRSLMNCRATSVFTSSSNITVTIDSPNLDTLRTPVFRGIPSSVVSIG